MSDDGTRRRPTSHRPKLGAMSVSLLKDLMHNTLDEGYAQAARRRAEAHQAGQPPPSATVGRALTALALLLVGIIVGVAFRQTQQRAPQSQRTRDALVHDVERDSAASNRLQRQAESLSDALADERDALLTRSREGDDAAARLARLEAASALSAVTGPGVTVVLGDARPRQQTDPVTGQQVVVPPDENGRILDRDIQSVVNALWTAGAEAISVNGERLSTTTPIRAAGDAILVDLMPVTSPYRVQAIGDPGVLLPRFADTVAARRFETYESTYGIDFDVHRTGRLRLRAASGSVPHYAQPVPTTPAASPPEDSRRSGTPTSGGGR